MATALFSFRVKDDLKQKLDSLAEATHRSRSFLATEALERYIELESWQIAHIEEGILDAEEGRIVKNDEVDRWLASWGSAKEIAAPKPRKRTRR